jgi:hypothetical protein
MSDSDLFRQYAKEAIVGSLASKDENEKRVLGELAGMWGKAATVSERMFTSPHSLPRAGEATPLIRSQSSATLRLPSQTYPSPGAAHCQAS